VRAVDPTWLMQRRLVLKTYTNESASAIALDLIATYTRGVSGAYIQPGLPVIDVITFTNEQVPACLTAVCQRIGAYWYLDYQWRLHVFTSEAQDAYPITDASPRTSRHHALREDLSQVVTSVIGRGGGAAAAVDLPAGQTEIPIDEGDESQSWYSAAGGSVEINAQRVNYGGVLGTGGTGAQVGTGNAPANAPFVWQAGPGFTGGSAMTPLVAYQYAITFLTAAGESLPGPRATGTVSNAMPPSPVQPTLRDAPYGPSAGDPNQPVIGGVYYVTIMFPFDNGSYGMSPPTGLTWNGKYWQLYTGPTAMSAQGFTYYPALHPPGYVPPSRYRQILFNRTSPAGSPPSATYYGAGHIDVPTGLSYSEWYTLNYVWSDSDTIGGGGGGQRPPVGPPFAALWLGQLPKSALAAVTGRKLYRTTGGGAQLKLLATLNTTDSEYVDVAGDGALGANAPTADTSGIEDKAGNVLQNATTMPVSSLAPFEADNGASGGWVRVGSMVVRYTGIDTVAGTLTGIPSSGPGSITATVRYGTQVLVQPRLVGVPASGADSLRFAIRKGDTVTIRIERDDPDAISAMAHRLQLPWQAEVQYEDGRIELAISDSRLGPVELAATVQATLLERKDPHRTLTFESRDPSLQVGRLVTVTISKPPISGTFRIQRITFSEIAISGARGNPYPLRAIEATNKLYTFADLLRQLRGREGGVP
jgi:hypothetical protein